NRSGSVTPVPAILLVQNPLQVLFLDGDISLYVVLCLSEIITNTCLAVYAFYFKRHCSLAAAVYINLSVGTLTPVTFPGLPAQNLREKKPHVVRIIIVKSMGSVYGEVYCRGVYQHLRDRYGTVVDVEVIFQPRET